MAKHVLNIKDEDFDFLLIGLSIQQDQYETVVAINEALQINLVLSSHVSLALKEKSLFYFSLFSYEDKDFGITYLFIPNLSNFEAPNSSETDNRGLFSGLDIEERARLIKELPLTDYFLIVKGEEVQKYRHKLMDQLKVAEGVMRVQYIDVSELPSKSNLVF